MGRRVLYVHADVGVREQLARGTPEGFEDTGVGNLDAGEIAHARTPFDMVVVELDPDAAVVRRLRSWHPEPAVVAISRHDGPAADAALTSGAHDHLGPDTSADEVTAVIEQSWRRHRAMRTRRAGRAVQPDLEEVRRRIGQLVSLTTAAKELLGVDEPPHTTVHSLLQQARELGLEATELTGRSRTPENRGELDLEGMVTSAWAPRDPRGTPLEVRLDPVTVHGHPTMLRTALVVLFTHALREVEETSRVVVDTEVLPDAVQLRIHDDGPNVPLGQRAALFQGGNGTSRPRLMAVEHVAARHGGTAWLADSDVITEGTMTVIELPRRALPR